MKALKMKQLLLQVASKNWLELLLLLSIDQLVCCPPINKLVADKRKNRYHKMMIAIDGLQISPKLVQIKVVKKLTISSRKLISLAGTKETCFIG